MSFITSILSGGTAKLVEAVGTVFDKLFTSDDERAKAQLAMLQVQLAAQANRDSIAAELEKAYLADAASVREQAKIEVQSEDWFVRRGRPAAVWIGVVILAWNYVIRSLIGMVAVWAGATVPIAPMELPSAFWEVWTVLVVGYNIMRTIDKRRAAATGTPTE